MRWFGRKKKGRGREPQDSETGGTSQESQLDPRLVKEFAGRLGVAAAGLAEDKVREAQAAMSRADWSEAIKQYTDVIRVREESDAAINMKKWTVSGLTPLFALYGSRGTAYAHKGDYQSALTDYNKALEIEPDNVYSLDCRGRMYYMSDKYEEAIKDFSKALTLGSESDNTKAQIYANRAVAYRELHKYELTLKDLDAAAKICTDDKLRNTLKRLAKESFADHGTEKLKACPQCGKKVHLLQYTCPSCGNTIFVVNPSDQEYIQRQQAKAAEHVDKGSKLFFKRRYKDAEGEFSAALEINPVNATAYANLGILYLRTGRPQEALTYFEKAQELSPRMEGLDKFLNEARNELRKNK